MGGVNIQVAQPRAGEEGLAERVRAFLAAHRKTSIAYSAASHSGPWGTSQIDITAVPTSSANDDPRSPTMRL